MEVFGISLLTREATVTFPHLTQSAAEISKNLPNSSLFLLQRKLPSHAQMRSAF